MRPVPLVASEFVAQHEACRLQAYRDAGRGVITIGYGHTRGVRLTDKCSQFQANLWLDDDLTEAAELLAKVVDEAVILKLSDHQYAALISFVFNCGQRPGATLWKRVNAGNFAQIPAELMKWIYVGKRVVPGLANRRAAEVALWNTPDPPRPALQPVESHPNPSSAVTRDAVAPHPPEGFLAKLKGLFA